MKRFVCMFIIAALGLALCACTHTPASVPTPAPVKPDLSPAAPQFSLIPATPAPQESGSMADIFAHGGTELGEADGVTYSEERVFYPEGADEASALFTLEYTLPVFGGGFIGASPVVTRFFSAFQHRPRIGFIRLHRELNRRPHGVARRNHW